MVKCIKCNNKPVKIGSLCEDCASGIQNPDTGIGKEWPHTDAQGRRR